MSRLFLTVYLVCISLSVFASKSGSTPFEEMLFAAKNGDPEAQRSIGLSYHFGSYILTGEKIKQDHQEAIKWLTLSSENGSCFSPWFLGGIYHEGKGVGKNEEFAAKYFLLAAKRGNIKAQTNIAAFYYYGISVSQDFDKAYAWASLANFQHKGDKNIQALLNMIIPALKNREASDAFAEKYFERYRNSQDDCGNT